MIHRIAEMHCLLVPRSMIWPKPFDISTGFRASNKQRTQLLTEFLLSFVGSPGVIYQQILGK
jgi:hypothetical protein